jgi:hypothetical protein
MGFVDGKLSAIHVSQSSAGKFWIYKEDNTLAAIQAADYFNPAYPDYGLSSGDIIMMLGSDAYSISKIDITGGSVTVAESIGGAESTDFHTIPFAATINPDWSDSINQRCVLTSSITVGNSTNAVEGQTYTLMLQQDITGSWSVSWGTQYKFDQTGLPSISGASDTFTIFKFIYWNNFLYLVSTGTGYEIT